MADWRRSVLDREDVASTSKSSKGGTCVGSKHRVRGYNGDWNGRPSFHRFVLLMQKAVAMFFKICCVVNADVRSTSGILVSQGCT